MILRRLLGIPDLWISEIPNCRRRECHLQCQLSLNQAYKATKGKAVKDDLPKKTRYQLETEAVLAQVRAQQAEAKLKAATATPGGMYQLQTVSGRAEASQCRY